MHGEVLAMAAASWVRRISDLRYREQLLFEQLNWPF